MRLLFICSQNRLRSPTAEKVFEGSPGIEVKSAGTESSAVTVLTTEHLAWADVVVVMEKSHRNKIFKHFREPLIGKRVVVLGIPDDYEYMQPELIDLLKTLVPQLVGF